MNDPDQNFAMTFEEHAPFSPMTAESSSRIALDHIRPERDPQLIMLSFREVAPQKEKTAEEMHEWVLRKDFDAITQTLQ
jgi:hypothetical protein